MSIHGRFYCGGSEKARLVRSRALRKLANDALQAARRPDRDGAETLISRQVSVYEPHSGQGFDSTACRSYSVTIAPRFQRKPHAAHATIQFTALPTAHRPL
jgi:hypothetical protein